MSALEVAKAWSGRPIGPQFLCRCPLETHGAGKGDRRPSLTVRDGDNGDVLFDCKAGCDWRDLKRLARSQGLIPELRAEGGCPAVREHRQAAPLAEHKPNADALSRWRAAKICTDREVVRRYISNARGIGLDLPPTIRQGTAMRCGRVPLPTMIAAVQRPDGKVVAVQETSLTWNATKAPLTAPRLTTGALGYGAVRLAPAEEALGIAEGVETGLAAMELSGIPCWAGLGAQRLSRLWLPDVVRTVFVFADSDDAGRKAATAASEAYGRQGRKVLIRYPQPGFNDWNDQLRAEVMP